MSSISTIECYGKLWIASQVYGESRSHLEIAAGALTKRTPYCRKNIVEPSRNASKSPFPESMKQALLSHFDLSTDFDVLVVQHDVRQDPLEEFAVLQVFGREILSAGGVEVPNFAYLENLHMSELRGSIVDHYLSPSDRDDLLIASRAMTAMLFEQHND